MGGGGGEGWSVRSEEVTVWVREVSTLILDIYTNKREREYLYTICRRKDVVNQCLEFERRAHCLMVTTLRVTLAFKGTSPKTSFPL